MPQIRTSGVTNALVCLRDQATGEEINLDVGMYERNCLLIQPMRDHDSSAEMKIVYSNKAVRLFIREHDGRSFSVTLWDYAEPEVQERAAD